MSITRLIISTAFFHVFTVSMASSAQSRVRNTSLRLSGTPAGACMDSSVGGGAPPSALRSSGLAVEESGVWVAAVVDELAFADMVIVK